MFWKQQQLFKQVYTTIGPGMNEEQETGLAITLQSWEDAGICILVLIHSSACDIVRLKT